jgi:hypothetical protein
VHVVVLTAFAGLLGIGGASAGTHPVAAKKSGATWGIGPSNPKKLDGRANFKWFVSPGGELTDHVAIQNISRRPLTLDLYARAAANAANGQLSLQPEAAPATDIGSWVTIGLPHHATSVRIPARSTAIVPFTLKVPANASPGDHTGGIISSLSAKVRTGSSTHVNPTLEQRVAVAMIARVKGPIYGGLAVSDFKASYKGTLNPFGSGSSTLSYNVVNNGNVNLGAKQTVSVKGLFGTTKHLTSADVPGLLPGGSATISIPVSGVFPEGVATAKVELAPLVPSGDVDPGLKDTAFSAHFYPMPWTLLATLVVVVLGVVLVFRRRRVPARGKRAAPRGRRAASPKPDAPGVS